jgi:GT2 family glycosyltransferase
MKASFIIVNFNRKEELYLTISRTLSLINGQDYEVIIIDNASSDGSAEMVKQAFPTVKLIENNINIGITAWNRGFEVALGAYFILLDDDSQLDAGLESALNYLDANHDVGVLALNITGGAFQTSHWDNLSCYAGFIGCGAIIRKELYHKVGGYADWIFLYTNEYEFGIRTM